MKFKSWNEVTAVFGGTFDPPHEGHQLAVLGLFRNPGVKRVLIVPAASPPHKPCMASAEERSALVRLAFEESRFPGELRIDMRELERSRAQPDRPSFSFDTLSELKGDFPQLAFVVGADQIAQLHTWHRFPDLLELSHWIVLERKPDGRDIASATLRGWVSSGLLRPLSENCWETRIGSRLVLVPTDAPALSSTDIRLSIGKNGEPPSDSLSQRVLAHLKASHMYGTRGSGSK